MTSRRAAATCPFCSLLQSGLPSHVVYENGDCFVVLDRQSLGWAHCMVISKSHVEQVFQLDDHDYAALFFLAKLLAPALQAATGEKAVGFVAFGGGLPHAHLHLVPHSKADVLLNPRAYVKDLDDKVLAENAERLRPFLQAVQSLPLQHG